MNIYNLYIKVQLYINYMKQFIISSNNFTLEMLQKKADLFGDKSRLIKEGLI